MARIVVVEDDQVMQDLITGVLEHSSLGEAIRAGTGSEALELASRADDVSCFLVDVTLPDMNGVELIRLLRRLRNHEKTPILVITRRGDEDTIARAFRSGASDFLAKPFHPVELSTRVELALMPKISEERVSEENARQRLSRGARETLGCYRSSSVFSNFVSSLNRRKGSWARTTFIAIDHSEVRDDGRISEIINAVSRVLGPSLIMQAHATPTCLVVAASSRPELPREELARNLSDEVLGSGSDATLPIRVGSFITPTFSAGHGYRNIVKRALQGLDGEDAAIESALP